MEEHPTLWSQERPLIESRQRVLDRVAIRAEIQAAQAGIDDMNQDLTQAKSIIVDHSDLLRTVEELEESLAPLRVQLTGLQERIRGEVNPDELDLVRGEVATLGEERQRLQSQVNVSKAEAGKIRLQSDLSTEIEAVGRQLKRLGKIAAPQGEETEQWLEGMRREREGRRTELEQRFKQVSAPDALGLAQIKDIDDYLTAHRAQKYEEQLNNLATAIGETVEGSQTVDVQNAGSEVGSHSLPTHARQASWRDRAIHAADKKVFKGGLRTSQLTVAEGVAMNDADKARLQNEFHLKPNNCREKLTKHPSRVGGFTYLFERPDQSWVVLLDGGVSSKIMGRGYVTVLTETQLAGRAGEAKKHSKGFLTGEPEGQKRGLRLGRTTANKGGDG